MKCRGLQSGHQGKAVGAEAQISGKESDGRPISKGIPPSSLENSIIKDLRERGLTIDKASEMIEIFDGYCVLPVIVD